MPAREPGWKRPPSALDEFDKAAALAHTASGELKAICRDIDYAADTAAGLAEDDSSNLQTKVLIEQLDSIQRRVGIVRQALTPTKQSK